MPALLTILEQQSDDPEKIVCSTSSGWNRFIVLGGLLAISLLCLFWGEPRAKGTVLSLVFFGASMVSTVAAGSVTTVVFFRRAKRVEVTKAIFERRFAYRDYSYDEVSFSVRNFAMGNKSATPPEYVATIDGTNYVLNLPANFPATEERLPEVMARFGFVEEPNQRPLPTPDDVTPAATAPVVPPPDAAGR